MKSFVPFRAVVAAACILVLALPMAAQSSGSIPLVDGKSVKESTARPATRKPAASQPLLPPMFAGWQRQADRTGRDAAQVDPANAAVMQEYGFSDFEHATYTRDGRSLEIKAARFADAGGAYGTFTFYERPEMAAETIGDAAVSSGDSVLFYRGNVLVQAKFERVTAMSAAELRELASELPKPTGSAANLPTLPGYLPKQSLVAKTSKYIVGPAALTLSGVPLTQGQVRFDEGAEVVAAKYGTDGGAADLVLISYPTPQLAAERERAFEAQFAQQGSGAPTQLVRRSGPILAYATGKISSSEARSLLASVNYDANVTWSEPTFMGKRDNVGSLIVAALALAGIILLLALVAGLAFGGFRILMKRWFPDRVFDRSSDVEIIRLNIGK